MNEIFTIYSGNGDEYKLQFTLENSGIISNDVFDVLFNHGIDVIEVGLGRSAGSNITSPWIMAQIED